MPFIASVQSTLPHDWGIVTTRVAEGLREAVHEAVTEGAKEARTVRKFKDRTGKLFASIRSRIDSYDRLSAKGTIEAGANPKAPYAKFIEGGTRAHGPVRAAYLHFKVGDRWVRTKWVKGIAPMPFMRQARERAVRVLLERVYRSIDEAGKHLE